MPRRVPGITRSSLLETWKVVRADFKKMAVRDVVDYLEYDVEPKVWIEQLLREIEKGTYQPQPPDRFTLAKSNGFSRRMAVPHIPDLVLYRNIVDHLYARSKKREHKHVYFEQEKLSKIMKEIDDEELLLEKRGEKSFWESLLDSSVDYETNSNRRYRAWLHYHQYRRMLIFKKVYPFIVTTDITNFFDSVLYAKVVDALHEISAPPGMVNLLFLLLERLSFRGELSGNSDIGLPVEEFDCSRKLAHMVLYPHDDRMVELLGDEAYVRWMDDQNFGVQSRSDGLRALALVGSSLSRLHLTPNASKSRILSAAEARRHFHLDINVSLDTIDRLPHESAKDCTRLRAQLLAIWKRAKHHNGQGEWAKVLKRVYLYAGRSGCRFFRRGCTAHVLDEPQLTTRIADYIRASGSVAEHLKFVVTLWEHDEQIYEDVNLVLAESLLRVEPDADDSRELRALASALLRRDWRFSGSTLCAMVAPLLLLRCGDDRSIPLLKTTFIRRRNEFPKRVIRSAAIVYASYGLRRFEEVRSVAAELESNNLAETVRLIDRIRKYEDVPKYYSSRFTLRFDPIAKRKFVDMRTLVCLRLLRLGASKRVRKWVENRVNAWKKEVSEFDRALLHRTVEGIPITT